MRRPAKISVALVCFIALTALLLALKRDRGEPLEFEILDYVTGQPVLGATVSVSRPWTQLPVEKIPPLRLNSHRVETIVVETGAFQVVRFRKVDLKSRIWLSAPGYQDAFIEKQRSEECNNPDIYRIVYFGDPWLHDSAYQYVNRRKTFAVALEPIGGGAGRAGVRYPELPSEGSRERALAAVRRVSGLELESAKFRNGHWEIKFVPAYAGGASRYDVSETGEILGVHGDG